MSGDQQNKKIKKIRTLSNITDYNQHIIIVNDKDNHKIQDCMDKINRAVRIERYYDRLIYYFTDKNTPTEIFYHIKSKDPNNINSLVMLIKDNLANETNCSDNELYRCIICGFLSNNPREMYVLEDKLNDKIYLQCKKCEEGSIKNDSVIIIKNNT